MAVAIQVPGDVNLSQYTDVQRGTVFMFFLTILLVFVSTVIKIVANQLDPNEGAEYEDKADKKGPSDSEVAFDKIVIKSQIIDEEDTGTIQFLKKVS